MASAPLLASVADLGHALRLEVVAEGGETAEQLALLRRVRCDLDQGYGLHRPVDRVGIAQLLAAQPPLRLDPPVLASPLLSEVG
jgi:EAL domain-containing protein (putative c-di-GMP-specific phosphodiesterase class I)